MAKFRVALSGDFVKTDGSPTYPMFDLTLLTSDPNVEVAYINAIDGVMPGEALSDYDALILLAPKFNAGSIVSGSRLGLVARFGVGYDSVDVPSCTEADIALCITPDGVRRPVAVAILTFILALTGKLMIKDQLTRLGAEGFHQRAQHMGVGLIGKTLGSIGIGNIGAELFRLARPFEFQFIAHDPYADPALAQHLGIELVSLEHLFRHSDILCVNCPLTPQTRHIVNAERLAQMKSTAYVINTSRGATIDQAALTQALQDHRIAGAGLDVFEREPPDADDPILKLDNVILAPHALCWTDQCFAGNGAADIAAVLEFMRGNPPKGVVNRDVLTSAGWLKKLEINKRRYKNQ
jgi:phosphoglycerate dehydrogenase-like enzyme